MISARCICLAAYLLAASASFAQPDPASLEQRAKAEVVELHAFLEQWSNAELPATEAAFARFGDVIASNFLIIDPGGEMLGRAPIVEAIRSAHGRWRERRGRIRIENFALHHAAGGLALATYEEWHDFADGRVGILSSVLFGPAQGTPNELEWLHLHEVSLESEDR